MRYPAGRKPQVGGEGKPPAGRPAPKGAGLAGGCAPAYGGRRPPALRASGILQKPGKEIPRQNLGFCRGTKKRVLQVGGTVFIVVVTAVFIAAGIRLGRFSRFGGRIVGLMEVQRIDREALLGFLFLGGFLLGFLL